MHINVIVQQMAKLFLILCLGAVLAKIELLDVHTKQKLTKLLLYVTTPMMMIDAFCERMKTVELQEQADTAPGIPVGTLFLYSFLFYILLIVLAVLLVYGTGTGKKDRRLYLFMTVFGNVGFMGFPVVEAVYGSEGLFYAAILNSVFNIFVYTFGVVLMGGTSSKEGGSISETLRGIPWKKLLLTPAVLCTAVGVVIFVFRIHLPAILSDTCSTLGSLTSPLAMLVVGANLSGMKAGEMLTNMRMNIYVLLRQIALPLIFWLIIRQIVTHEVLAPTLLLLSCMPVANTTALFATEYGGNEKLASQGIFLTTLFSLVSFPLIIWICT
ncbi:MAG: AEC family transporter [Oscillospiraceae bacterium]|nr:AEC family transporter [Oscillospiraceae bacterium]